MKKAGTNPLLKVDIHTRVNGVRQLTTDVREREGADGGRELR